MILVNGCSFSAGAQLENHEDRYSNQLDHLLDEETVRNIAADSKDNNFSYFELYSYILHAKTKSELTLPKIIIWQLTDYYRYNLPYYGSSGTWKPNDWYSFLGNHSFRTIKTIWWPRYFKIQKHLKNLRVNNHHERAIIEESIRGFGTQILAEENGWPVGDSTFYLNELRTGVNIKSLELLCKDNGIQLIIVNYFPFSKKAQEDPIIKSINYDNYLIANPGEGGMYNNLLRIGFDQPDNYHFGKAGHRYQAEVLKRFIESKNKLVVEPHKTHNYGLYPVYDYSRDLVAESIEARDQLKEKLTS